MSDSSDPNTDRFNVDPLGVVFTQCCYCRHLEPGSVCPAFPDGIPEAILDNAFDHSRPYPGDHGVRFEPRDDVPAEVLESLRREFSSTPQPD